MCKWWPLLYRIGSHTPGFKFTRLHSSFVFSSDEVT